MWPHGELIGERFELEAQVGAGGMGTVYRARDRDGGFAAVKVLREGTSGARFTRECVTLSSLAHPNIVRYIAHGDRPRPFLAMEWIPGPTLANYLDGVGLDLVETAVMIGQIAAALDAAHCNGVVHRDLKPSNVIFRDGDLRAAILIDFGISHAVVGVPLTRTGTTLGTPGYMAPEQTTGSRSLDGRADVFGLGCLLYECLTGLPAFSGANQLAVHTKICLVDPDPPKLYCPELPPALDGLVDSMMAKNALARPRAAEVAERLSDLVTAGLPTAPRRTAGTMMATPTQLVDSELRGRQLRCTVLCTSVNETPSPDVLARALSRFGPLVEVLHVLHDGTLIAELQGDDPATAERAARVALQLRDTLPGHVVVATCTTTAARDAIERGAVMVATATLQALFTSLSATIYLDREMARRLGTRFQVELTDDGGRLV